MTILQTSIDTNSKEFHQNTESMMQLVEELQQLTAKIALGGNEQARTRHKEQGKLFVRERIDLLLDPDSRLMDNKCRLLRLHHWQ